MTRSGLAELLKLRREKAGLTQEELADLSGVGRSTISAIEQGNISIPQPAILRPLVANLPMTMGEACIAMGYEDPRGEPAAAFFAEADAMEADLEEMFQRWRQRLLQRPPEGQRSSE